MHADTEPTNTGTSVRRTARWSRAPLIVLFVITALTLSAAGRFLYDSQRTSIVAQKGSELTSIRDLKVAQIRQWRETLRSDGAALLDDPTTADELEEWAAAPDDPRMTASVRGWLDSTCEHSGYAEGHLISPDGSSWVVSSGGTAPTSLELEAAAVQASSSEATLSDLYLDPATELPRMDVIAPITLRGFQGRAVLILQSDPQEFLFPLIQGWPVPSASSETLLVRREGDRVLYLNDLRFKDDAALRFTVPASDSLLLAAQALSDGPRVVEGTDYRGVDVIGAVGPVEGSPWFIVAKIDRAEAFARVVAAERTILGGVTLLVLVAGIGLFAVWRQNAAAFYRQALEAERATRVLSQQYAYLTRYANDAVILADDDLRVIQVNDSAERLYGYGREEFLGMPLALLRDPMQLDFPALDSRLAGSGGREIYEVRHVTKTGRLVDVEVSASSIESDEGTLYLEIVRDISERKRAEADAAEREARNRALLDNAPYGAHMYRLMADGRLVFTGFNARAESMLGIDHAALIGKTLEEAFPGNVGTETPDAYRRVAREGGTWSTDQVGYDAGEVTGAFEVYAFSFGPNLVSVFFRDVTELRRSEHELRRTSAYLENLIDYANAPIIVWDPDLRITRFNHAFERLTGMTGDEVIGRKLDLLFPDKTRAASLAEIDRAMRGESWESVEIPILRADGESRIALWNSANIYDEDAGALTAVIAQGQDITDRKRVEAELARQVMLFETALESLPVGIFMVEAPSGRPLVANERAKTILGRGILPDADESNLGEVYRAFREGTDEAYPVDEMPITAGMHGRSLHIDDMAVERPDGSRATLEVFGSPIRDENGRVWASLVGFLDITERKLAERELEERTDDLLRSNSELEKFAYVASHDLQEPLRMISSYTQLLQKRYHGQLDADADEFIAYAVDGAARMRALINELLAYSRVGTQGAPFAPTHLDAVVEGVLRMVEPTAIEAGAEITCDPMPVVWGDQTQLGQVFQNLITNAMKFRGTEPPKIHIGAHREGPEWIMSVADNGIGIDHVYFDRIFVIFQRLQSRADYAGTGMGLAICKRIIERHGGRIWVESAPGAGSTFYFTLRAEGEAEK